MIFDFRLRAVLYLLPTIFRAVLGLGTLPLMTLYLMAEDYGFFALVVVVANVFAVLPTLGSSVVTTQYFAPGDNLQRSEIVSNMVFLSPLIGLASALSCLVAWFLVFKFYPEYNANIPPTLLILASLTVVFNGWSVLASEITTLDNQSGTFAVLNITKDVSASLSSLAALYWFDMGVNSLFIGYIVAGLIGGLGGGVVLRRYVKVRPSIFWVKRIVKEYQIIFAQLFEQASTAVERSIIASGLGLSHLGIYNHSKLYESILMATATSIARTSWSDILKEVRDGDRGSHVRSWYATQAVMLLGLLGGIFFSTVGYDVIGLLSHQKFNDASYLAAIWSVLVSLRSTGFVPKAIIYSTGNTRIFSITIILGQLVMIACLLLLIDDFGLMSLTIAFSLATVTQKFITNYMAYQIQKFEFQDYYTILSVCLVFVFVCIAFGFELNIYDRAYLFVVYTFISYLVTFPAVNALTKLIFKRVSAKR